MRGRSKITTMFLGRLSLLGLLFVGTEIPPAIEADVWTESPSGARTLLYRFESGKKTQTPPEITQTPSLSPALPVTVSIFYPTLGQAQGGTCWGGLRIDSHDNVYPIGGNLYKILPDGTLVNGVNDQNFFAYNGNSFWFELDESRGELYTASGSDVRVASFTEGSTFSVLISGLDFGRAITRGLGPLVGSLFATDATNRVSRITLSPLGLSVFTSESPFFYLEAIGSAPDGTLYVPTTNGINATWLTKITPTGVPSTFATGTVAQVNRAVIVDKAGNVYWSHAKGINKYDANGTLLRTLPGPPDKRSYGGPIGAAFDSKGNLYIVENWDCKKIYKYTFTTPVTIDITPSSFPNIIDPEGTGLVSVAVLSTAAFNAATIDATTVWFGAKGTEAAPVQFSIEDVDHDTAVDMLLQFPLQATGIQCRDTSAALTGETVDGETIAGSDSIQTVGCP